MHQTMDARLRHASVRHDLADRVAEKAPVGLPIEAVHDIRESRVPAMPFELHIGI